MIQGPLSISCVTKCQRSGDWVLTSVAEASCSCGKFMDKEMKLYGNSIGLMGMMFLLRGKPCTWSLMIYGGCKALLVNLFKTCPIWPQKLPPQADRKLANLRQRVIFINYLRIRVSFERNCGGVCFVLDAASCISDSNDAATSSGENGADVAGCRQHQLRYKVCVQRDSCWLGNPPIPMAGHLQRGSVPPLVLARPTWTHGSALTPSHTSYN